ncbi:MAG: hypothetical protein KIH01_01755 [Candidatus Freyarchaeota archaeon]|nr:hypothetical protein [Candidatus Jordarchaeia archaeon]
MLVVALEELNSALQYLLKAKEKLENGGSASLELWFARAKLEVFLAKLSLKHGLEEAAIPKFRGKVDLNSEFMKKLIEELGFTAEAYRSGRFEDAFRIGWHVREALTKLL